MRVLSAALLLVVGCTSFEIADEPEIVTATRNVGIEIPDDTDVGLTDIAQIERSCLIGFVELDVDIRHPFRGDVFAELTSPSGTLLILKNTADNDETADVVGTFPTTLMPLQPLDRFEGEEGMGGWRFKAGDLGEDDVGTLESWTIRLGCF